MKGSTTPASAQVDADLRLSGIEPPLLPVELAILDALPTGKDVDLRAISDPPATERVPVRAAFLRAVLAGRLVPEASIDPHGVQVTGAAIADRLDFDDLTFHRPVVFTDCELAAGLSAERATLLSLRVRQCDVSGPGGEEALSLDQAQVIHGLDLSGSTMGGCVSLMNTTLGGPFHCVRAAFTNDAGPALRADRLTTTGSAYLAGTFTGHGERGAVRLLGAHIGGQLDCAGGTFTNDAGPALHGDGLTTTGNAYLTGTFTGYGELGAVRLLGANIGGQLTCAGGTVTNDAGPALNGDGLTTTGNAYLTGTFTGHGELGAVRLLGANIGGQLTCAGGTVTNDAGPALDADGLTTTDNAYLTGTFIGYGERGAVRLLGANIGGQLTCAGGSFTNVTGPALNADELTAEDLFLEGTFRGPAGSVLVSLIGAQLRRHLVFKPFIELEPDGKKIVRSGVPVPGSVALWLQIDGLTYQGIPSTDGRVQTWVALLKQQTDYAAQPWQHLAAAYRNAGHDADAKTILIEQQRDRRERIVKGESPWRTTLMWLSDKLTGYGYKASRALLWLVGWAVIGVLVAVGAGQARIDVNTDPAKPPASTTVLARKPPANDPAAATGPCSAVEWIGLGLEWTVPILTTDASSSCQLNTTQPQGQAWAVATWLLRLGGWALATIAVAGYTGIVRRL